MSAIKGISIGTEVLEALSLSEQNVTSIDLHIRMDEAVEIRIVKYAKLEDIKKLLKVIKRYQLIDVSRKEEKDE